MPPRLHLCPLRHLQQLRHTHHRLCLSYSTQTEEPPLIRVTNLPAPSTGHIRILELNRPKARNALSRALLAALRTEVDHVQKQYSPDGQETGLHLEDQRTNLGPTRALVLASAVDACFCAGADLKERRGFTPTETTEFLTNLRATFTALSELQIPTVSAISSVALGGGLELALSTHFRVLSSNAIVGLPETRLGIIPGAGGTARLPAIVGISRARDLILTGRRVSASEAYFLGLADRLVEIAAIPEKRQEEQQHHHHHERQEGQRLEGARKLALAEAVRLAQEICEGGPVAIRASLQAVGWGRLDKETEMYERVVATEDRDEALRAFQEKRKPVFKGR
ncbi:hypothetical protein E4U57_005594 [Claviceps arundinis]|uniref:Uncharacterized protein n=1 Tax=Claviceps arundinis TaxID=1623583 RepID=A0A9P7MYI2_9HYPO|nr:hypothetical protein E4U57_005594 [Claviceps arundinis]KAG5973318.1 hypothetical protein E4U56_005105 [Claviceps arundinis]